MSNYDILKLLPTDAASCLAEAITDSQDVLGDAAGVTVSHPGGTEGGVIIEVTGKNNTDLILTRHTGSFSESADDSARLNHALEINKKFSPCMKLIP